MTDQSIGDALQEQWANTAKDAAFGRTVKKLYLNKTVLKSYDTTEFYREVSEKYQSIYGGDKDNG